jgi:hypothetical protein
MQTVGADDVVGLNGATVAFLSLVTFRNSSYLFCRFYYIRRSASIVSKPMVNGVRKLRIRGKQEEIPGRTRR